ncbi:MAG: TRAP transporter substrate-binding protein [Lautropia sp.]
MKRNFMCAVAGMTAAVATGSLTRRVAAADKPIELSMTSSLSPDSLHSLAMTYWGKELEKRTGGQVKIGQMTWAGTLLKADSLAQGIGRGIADVGYAAASLNPSHMPMSNAVFPNFINEGTPWRNIHTELFRSVPEINAEWTKLNIRPLYFVEFPPQLLMTTFKTNGISDFKAKRMRAVGASHYFVANLGGIPISIGAAETYTALQKGTVEGVSGNPAYTVTASKFHEVIKQAMNTRNGDYTGWLGAAINIDTYNRLPDSAKKVIAELEKDVPQHFNRLDREASNKAFDTLKQKGIDIVQLSPETAKQWYKVINPPAIWDVYVKEAEARGLKPRPVLERLVAIAREHEAKHPGKTVVEQWAEANPGYVKVI